jgi:dimethylargininase
MIGNSMVSIFAKAALVRPVPDSYTDCVRTSIEKIDVVLAKAQHRFYCEALQSLGLRLLWAERDDSLPDSCFVEDTAFIVNETAVICNMSVESRAPEVVGVAEVLKELKRTTYITKPGTIDGGDVLRIEDKVFVGLTARTNREAIDQISRMFENRNLEVIPVKVRNVLHLKSACTYLANNYVVLSKGNFDTRILSGLDRIVVPKGEEYAADCLAVNGTVLMAQGYPRTKKLVENEGFSVVELDMSEFRKGDGALTCLSIIL